MTQETKVGIGDVKKKYRIVIQEKLSKHCKKEKCRSFMIYDYTGNSNIDTIKEKLIKYARK